MKNKILGIIINKNIKPIKNNKIETPTDEDTLLYPFYKCSEKLIKFVVKYGVIPLLLIYEKEKDLSNQYLDMIDGLLMIGDKDISKEFYDKKNISNENLSEIMNKDKMNFQIKMLNKILVKKEKDIPILGICAGCQSLNVCFGGTLYNDIKTDLKSKIIHSPTKKNPSIKYHKINIKKDTLLYDIIKKNEIIVSSNHHQSVKDLGKNILISSQCQNDNVIESIEYKNSKKICIGLQWHIEKDLTEYDSKIMKAFIKNM